MTVYLETSATLAWLVGEPVGEKVRLTMSGDATLTTSALTLLEMKRALIRLEALEKIKAADRSRLLGILENVSSAWMIMELTEEVKQRATLPFPAEPIRTLDAIHLATALEFVRAFPELKVLSLDRRILDNLGRLGLAAVAI